MKISLLTEPAKKPIRSTHVCFTHLEFLKNSCAYLGECAPAGKYGIELAGRQVAEFKGCQSQFVLSVPKDFWEDKDSIPPKILGSCHAVPIRISNATLRILFTGLFILVFGGIFIFGVLLFYSHRDSSEESIYQAHT